MKCGECTICCLVTACPELQKPVNRWCRFCTVGKGCRIYDRRPPSCKKFMCLWFEHTRMPVDLRPDKCHVMFESLPGYSIVMAYVDPDNPEAWHSSRVMEVINALVINRQAVMVTVEKGEKDLLLPIGMKPEDVWHDLVEFAKGAGVIKEDSRKPVTFN